jgi:hypothetical protein
MIDEKSVPHNHVMFNPSVAHPMLYIRFNHHFATKEENGIFLCNLQTNQNYTIQSPWHLLKNSSNLFLGIEDLRICWKGDQLWFSGTCTHASDNMTSELVVGYFDKNFTKVERMSHVDIGSIPVKNVCPFVVDNKVLLFDIYLRAIYEVSDSYTIEDGKQTISWVKFVATKIKDLVLAPGIQMDGYRGSSCPVHIHGNTYGCIVHDIIFNDQAVLMTRLSYIHYWMEFDIESGVISFMSTPFWAAHWGIEYISGIHLDKATNGVTLYIGVNDQACVSFSTTLYNLRIGK